jgi:hypothetical protein
MCFDTFAAVKSRDVLFQRLREDSRIIYLITSRIPGVISLGVKLPGREADHAPPSAAEVKNA